MVFGESILTDAAALVLTKTLLTFHDAPVTTSSVAAACVSFLCVFTGAAAIGIAFGLLSALLYKQLEVHRHGDASLEAALSFTFPWASYFLAEAKELSGVVVMVMDGEHMSYRPAFPMRMRMSHPERLRSRR